MLRLVQSSPYGHTGSLIRLNRLGERAVFLFRFAETNPGGTCLGALAADSRVRRYGAGVKPPEAVMTTGCAGSVVPGA
jgi:hypothetical protein